MGKLCLLPEMFGPTERMIWIEPGVRVSAFRYSSGTAGLRIVTGTVDLVTLPFQGMQIWSMTVNGRPLGMISPVTEPRPTQDFLATFGGVLVHCGLTGVGAPGPGEDRPLHGELPNAPMDSVWIETGPDGLKLCSRYRHARLFGPCYEAMPWLKVCREGGMVRAGIEVTNLSGAPIPVRYLAHVNFRPALGGRIVQTAPFSFPYIELRQRMPAHLADTASYGELTKQHAADLRRHAELRDGDQIDPELVWRLRLRADEEGWAHVLQLHQDGSADAISFSVDEFPVSYRWLSRTGIQDCIALAEPATCGMEGFERGPPDIVLAKGGRWSAEIRLGAPNSADLPALLGRCTALSSS